VALLVLPYAVIPHNMSSYRVYAWLPWLAGIVAVALQVATDRFAGVAASPRTRIVLAVAGIAIASLAAWSHQAARTKVASDYTRVADSNRRMVETLVALRAEIGDAPVVGLVGLDGPSPWCAKSYLYDKLGFHNRWIAFVSHESTCYRQRRPDAVRHRRMHMTVVSPDRLCRYGALPVLEYAVDGSGRLKRAGDYCTTKPDEKSGS